MTPDARAGADCPCDSSRYRIAYNQIENYSGSPSALSWRKKLRGVEIVLKRIGFIFAVIQIVTLAMTTGFDLPVSGRVGAGSAFAQSAAPSESASDANIASSPDASPPDVSGDWTGTLTDGNKGMGAFSMQITQTGSKLSGTWSSFLVAGSPSLSGKVSSKGVVHLNLSLEGKCHLVAKGTLPNANEILASYKYASCSQSVKNDIGAVDVTR